MTERLELRNIDLETKNKLRMTCDTLGISMSEYILNLINSEIHFSESWGIDL